MATNGVNGIPHSNSDPQPPQPTPPSSSSSSSSLGASIDRDGFVIIPSLLTPSELTTLRTACSRTLALARSGHWPHLRTLPLQFPPWPKSPPAGTGIWGIQHLLHPALPERRVFASSYFHPRILGAVREILGQEREEQLVMELYNLLVRPDEEFALRWHRDDVGWEVGEEEERVRLQEPAFHAQWNLALWRDESLVVVPGSQGRVRTKEEREADVTGHMPGEKVVRLEAGDVVFYNNNIVHRGIYAKDVERMTLHGSIGDVRGGGSRARNVLQHGVGEWVEDCDLSMLDEETRETAEGMRKRLVELGRGRGDVGYSQKN
ncbi:phytanoyl-CoA dioxygenase family protein [Viridothelium virens]|uniref:Phytanoyl-CoA dioxygenase family protein n=1 Tax=Viridothelium virens TaxID=1048519 RepID=A0A6A6HL84_VIRVR|nr:phytanoyl-CoA dioxygenase family protein [Viridothelium virens]